MFAPVKHIIVLGLAAATLSACASDNRRYDYRGPGSDRYESRYSRCDRVYDTRRCEIREERRRENRRSRSRY